jgi:hypothetical protein
MQIDQNFPEGAPRKLTVQGAAYNVKIAKDMIDTVMEKVRLRLPFLKDKLRGKDAAREERKAFAS